MIFGAVINEDLKDEILVTVIATGFEHQEQGQAKPSKPQFQRTRSVNDNHELNIRPFNKPDDNLDIPTFLRNRRNK